MWGIVGYAQQLNTNYYNSRKFTRIKMLLTCWQRQTLSKAWSMCQACWIGCKLSGSMKSSLKWLDEEIVSISGHNIWVHWWASDAQMLSLLNTTWKGSHLYVFTHRCSLFESEMRGNMNLFAIEKNRFLESSLSPWPAPSTLEHQHFGHYHLCHQPCDVSLWWLFLCLLVGFSCISCSFLSHSTLTCLE